MLRKWWLTAGGVLADDSDVEKLLLEEGVLLPDLGIVYVHGYEDDVGDSEESSAHATD